ncbi:MAG: biotin--[acetyl-CoA-carboxylase] ligase [Pirellula sp.]|nr:biotin--[acetyl-CoA-carboxylase] ligase [Pirellula sp.]
MLSHAMRRIHFELTDSTNTQARLLAASYPGERLLVTAAEQTAGRGRLGRQWVSPRGGAWLTIAWPMRLAPAAYRAASLAAVVGVRRALVELLTRGMPAEATGFAPRPLIKWPNDLLIDDAKVVGILCEQSLGSVSNGNIIYVGIGVNVAFDQSLLDEPIGGEKLRQRATTLSNAAGRVIAVDDVIELVSAEAAAALEQLEARGFAGAAPAGRPSLLDELRESLAYVGSKRTWLSPRGEINGVIVGVDDDGRLLLDDGQSVTACDAGELSGA